MPYQQRSRQLGVVRARVTWSVVSVLPSRSRQVGVAVFSVFAALDRAVVGRLFGWKNR